MQVWIGTSGYSYADWVGPFYPEGTRPPGMLACYVRHFPLVELNFTFYRLPARGQLDRIARQTPEGFRFLAKLPRSLSHERDTRELDAFRRSIDELKTCQRLSGVLCQLPQSFHRNEPNQAWVETLAREFAGSGLAVEFRHRSWDRPSVPDWLRSLQADLVAVDVPDIGALYPRGLVRSGSRVYVRFHSRRADRWYQSDKERYDYGYGDAELSEWIVALHAASPQVSQALLLFNNCHRGQAAANAQRMRELMRRLAPDLEVVAPFDAGEPPPRQRSLFD